jgi:Short C-terminal domain
MLFLYRPRQTWMPYRLPREPAQQDAYNRQMQESFSATRRVGTPAPAAGAAPASPRDPIEALKELGQLHTSGVLTDAEFASAKAKVLGSSEQL